MDFPGDVIVAATPPYRLDLPLIVRSDAEQVEQARMVMSQNEATETALTITVTFGRLAFAHGGTRAGIGRGANVRRLRYLVT
jgi:hypothetical protein